MRIDKKVLTSSLAYSKRTYDLIKQHFIYLFNPLFRGDLMLRRLNLLVFIGIAAFLILPGALGQVEVKAKKLEVPKVSLGVYVNEAEGQVYILEPVNGGPAEKAGLLAKDRILMIGETKILKVDDVKKAMKRVKPGDKLLVHVERDGKKLAFKVVPGVGAKVFKNAKAPNDLTVENIKKKAKKLKTEELEKLKALGYISAIDAPSSASKAKSSCETCPSKGKCGSAKAKSSCGSCPSKASCKSKTSCKTKTFTVPGGKGQCTITMMQSGDEDCDFGMDFDIEDVDIDGVIALCGEDGKVFKKTFKGKTCPGKKVVVHGDPHSHGENEECEVIIARSLPQKHMEVFTSKGTNKGYTQGYRDGYRDAMRDAMEMLHKHKSHCGDCARSGKHKGCDAHGMHFFGPKHHKGVMGFGIAPPKAGFCKIDCAGKGCDKKGCGCKKSCPSKIRFTCKKACDGKKDCGDCKKPCDCKKGCGCKKVDETKKVFRKTIQIKR